MTPHFAIPRFVVAILVLIAADVIVVLALKRVTLVHRDVDLLLALVTVNALTCWRFRLLVDAPDAREGKLEQRRVTVEELAGLSGHDETGPTKGPRIKIVRMVVLPNWVPLVGALGLTALILWAGLSALASRGSLENPLDSVVVDSAVSDVAGVVLLYRAHYGHFPADGIVDRTFNPTQWAFLRGDRSAAVVDAFDGCTDVAGESVPFTIEVVDPNSSTPGIRVLCQDTVFGYYDVAGNRVVH